MTQIGVLMTQDSDGKYCKWLIARLVLTLLFNMVAFKQMNISITFSIPVKARIYKKEGVLLYLGIKKWLLSYGKMGRMIWVRILGFTFTIGYFYWFRDFEFNFRIQ